MTVEQCGGTSIRIAERGGIAERSEEAAYDGDMTCEVAREVKTSRRILVAAAILACAVFAIRANAADLHAVKAVYLLSMANGMDQYLAGRLTAGSVIQVVTDPHKADAIFTDHVGETFEKSLDDLFGSVPVPKDGKATETFARVGGGQRSRGTFFLVDRKTRDILWSDEEIPKGTSPEETRRIAGRIADHLGKALKGQ